MYESYPKRLSISKILAYKILFVCLFFFNSVLRPFQDYFSSYETGQSVGGAKTGEPREKPPEKPVSCILNQRSDRKIDCCVVCLIQSSKQVTTAQWPITLLTITWYCLHDR